MTKLKRMVLCSLGGIALLFFMGAANASLICVGLGNDFDDANCDYTEINAALGTSFADNDALKDALIAGNAPGDGNPEGPSGGNLSLNGSSGGPGGTVEWTLSNAETIPLFWTNKYDGVYEVYAYMGPDGPPWSDSATQLTISELDPTWISCGSEPGGQPNCSAGTSHVKVYGVDPVPLPAAVWLLGSALLGLVGIGRFSRRRRVLA